MNNQEIHAAYKQLQLYNGAEYKYTKFLKMQMEGYIKKTTEQTKIFSMADHHRRFMLISYNDATVYLKHSKDEKKESKLLPFRNI